ncbi:MAG: exodeoxyribonuclease VII large subunit [Pseudomonadota bacterium]|nr:exodeoxyribonuclease VII large subunit [Pseudomonadota bacterium]
MTDTVAPASNVPEYSVSDLSQALKKTVEDRFGLVRVRGEVSQPKFHTSGHTYLRLKDDRAVIEAVCWKGTHLPVRPEDGMEVICTGRLTTYPGRSQYQLVIENLELAGEGALLKMLEDRRRRLAAEGLFDAARKKPLPFLPSVIGVITSPGGAVFHDILHRLSGRFPCHVLLWPVAVQGQDAAAQIAAAIAGFNAIAPGGPVPRPDLLIVARGGGSLEDLMPFNEEVVVRAAVASSIPLISGVGHEPDITLIDHAADWRAPTPTGAAERAVPEKTALVTTVAELSSRLQTAPLRWLKQGHLRLEALRRGLLTPTALVRLREQAVTSFAGRLHLAARNMVQKRTARWETLSGLLDSCSFHSVLARGYALVRDNQSHVISSAANLKPGQPLSITLKDGTASAVVGNGTVPEKPARKKKRTPPQDQPGLFGGTDPPPSS